MSLEYPDLNILQTNCSNSRQNEFLLNFTSLLFCYIFEAGKVNSEKREEYFENIICRERNIGRKNQIGKILNQRPKYRKTKWPAGKGLLHLKVHFNFYTKFQTPNRVSPDFLAQFLPKIFGKIF